MNFKNGEILIAETKRNKERIVVMSDDMLYVRSIKSLEFHCDRMSVQFLMCQEDGNLYDKVSVVFG